MLLMVGAILHVWSQQKATELTNNMTWISTQDTDKDGLPMFRKVFELETLPQNAILTATALGIYDVELNGERIGDQELKPGWTDYRKEVAVQTFDASGLLRKGRNELKIQLSKGWWAGGISRGVYGKHLKLEVAAKIEMDGVCTICTDHTWEYAIDGPLKTGDIYNGETYDARCKPSVWKSAIETGRTMPRMITSEGPAVRIREQELWRKPQGITIYSDTIATGTHYGMIKVDRTIGNQPFTLKKGETAVVDMGQNMVGWIKFTARARKGTEITMRHGEMLNYNGDKKGRLDDGPGGSVWSYNLREAKALLKYTFNGEKEGETWHPKHTFMGFRYVSITATDDVEIDQLTGQVVGSDISEWGEFECSDERVNKLFSNIRWGQRGNFLSIPTDCPQRDERLGWTGDTQIFARTALYNSDAKDFYRKWMRDMRNSQREDGAYPDIAPFPSFWSYGTSAWGDAGVIVPWTVYEMTGDKTILEENLESMERWMDWLSQQHDTIVTEEHPQDTIVYQYSGGGTSTGDWLSYAPLEQRYVSVAYYAYVARLMENICMALDREEKARKYRQLYSNIREEFQKRYLDSDDRLTHHAQTAYLLALKLQLLPDACKEEARQSLRKSIEDNDYRLNTGFVGTGILCNTLSDEGMNDLAYALLLQRENPSWLYSVDQGATTVWERWDSYTIEGGFHKHHWNMNSFNHYAYGVVAEWMYAYMGGIRPAAPGFKKVLLSPCVDNRADNHPSLRTQSRINWVKVKTHTPQGDIKTEWERTADGHYHYTFTLPKGIEYEVRIPGLTDYDKVSIVETE